VCSDQPCRPQAQAFLAEVTATPLRAPYTGNDPPAPGEPARAALAAPAPTRPDALIAMPAATQTMRVTTLLMRAIHSPANDRHPRHQPGPRAARPGRDDGDQARSAPRQVGRTTKTLSTATRMAASRANSVVSGTTSKPGTAYPNGRARSLPGTLRRAL